MSAPSYYELLRDAEAAQRKRDEDTQLLKQKKKEEEEERRRAILNQHKRLKPASETPKEPAKPAQLGDLLATYKIPKKPRAKVDNRPQSSCGSSDYRSLRSDSFSSRKADTQIGYSQRSAFGHRSSGHRDEKNYERRSYNSTRHGTDRLPAKTSSEFYRRNSVPRQPSQQCSEKPRLDVASTDHRRSNDFLSARGNGGFDRTKNQFARGSSDLIDSKPHAPTTHPRSSVQHRPSEDRPQQLKPLASSFSNDFTSKAVLISPKKPQLTDEEKRRIAKERKRVEESKRVTTKSDPEPADDFFAILSSAKYKPSHTRPVRPATKPSLKSEIVLKAPSSSVSKQSIKLPSKPTATSSSSSRNTPSESTRLSTSLRGSSNGTPLRGPTTSLSKPSSSSLTKKLLPGQNDKSSVTSSSKPRLTAPFLSFADMMKMAETNVKDGATPLNPSKLFVPNSSCPEASQSGKEQSNRFTSQSNGKLSSSAPRSFQSARSTLSNDRKPPSAPATLRKRVSSTIRDTPRSKVSKPVPQPPFCSNNQRSSRRSDIESQVSRNFQKTSDTTNRRSDSYRSGLSKSDPYRREPSRLDYSRNNNSSHRDLPSSQRRYDSQSHYKSASRRDTYYSEDEDEYDSMDDFIVSDGEEVPNSVLKNVVRTFCRSDELTWKQREREIDLGKMEANYHQVATEESRSARLARLEDLKEEQRGARNL